MGYLYFISCSLVYSLILILVYFKKEHINSNETRVFSTMLVLNFFGLVCELCCALLGNFYDPSSILCKITTKVYMIYLLTFLLYMTLYIYVVCYASNNNNNNNLNEEHYQFLKKISIIIYLVCISVMLFLPLNTASGYATGKAVDFVYISSAFCILVWLIPVIKNNNAPWELILWNRIISKKSDLLQLSIACGTMMSDKFLYDYEGPKMLLARLFLDIIKPINGYRRVNEKTIDKYEKFKQSYKEPDKFMLPKEESEIYEMLDDYFQNTR